MIPLLTVLDTPILMVEVIRLLVINTNLIMVIFIVMVMIVVIAVVKPIVIVMILVIVIIIVVIIAMNKFHSGDKLKNYGYVYGFVCGFIFNLYIYISIIHIFPISSEHQVDISRVFAFGATTSGDGVLNIDVIDTFEMCDQLLL